MNNFLCIFMPATAIYCTVFNNGGGHFSRFNWVTDLTKPNLNQNPDQSTRPIQDFFVAYISELMSFTTRVIRFFFAHR